MLYYVVLYFVSGFSIDMGLELAGIGWNCEIVSFKRNPLVNSNALMIFRLATCNFVTINHELKHFNHMTFISLSKKKDPDGSA